MTSISILFLLTTIVTLIYHIISIRKCRNISAGLTVDLETLRQKSAKFQELNESLKDEKSVLKLQQESMSAEYNALITKYSSIIDLADAQRVATDELRSTQAKQAETSRELESVKEQLVDAEAQLEIEAFGLYRPKFDYGSSEQFKREIDKIREQQKQMIKDREAIIWDVDIVVVGGSKADSRKLVNEQNKLMLRSFNAECDAQIAKVKYNNVQSVETKIDRFYAATNKLGQLKQCYISNAYLVLKKQELWLAHEYQQKLQDEREEQRQIRERIREEQRVLKEIEKAKREAEKEEQRYEKALERARREAGRATGEKQAQLNAEIEKLNQLLQDAHEKNKRAISRAQQTRSGHVYIISNIGSFGENVYKIGMTRRLEPLDRVKELGDASVPFRFDVHAMIYSEDAPGLESSLHQAFNNRRVNRVNNRKEFFHVQLDEIQQVVVEHDAEIEFTMAAEAAEYRQSMLMEDNGDSAESTD